jgi:transcriptional regulator with XRE-family HTH domain
MINKILFIARKAGKLTEKEAATALGTTEIEYKELESGIKRMTCELAEKLSELFDVNPVYFMTDEYSNLNDLTDALEKHRNLLAGPEFNQEVGSVHLRIVKMGIEASIAIQKNIVLLQEQRELKQENQALRELYSDLKNRKFSKQTETRIKHK